MTLKEHNKKAFTPKKELALRYFPDSDPHVAVNRLNHWIRRCKPLKEALDDTHIDRWAKSYTPQQVALIEHFLDE